MSLKIGLALSGGGGCGFAHIGVLQVLVENGIKIDLVAGTSMGSIVGAFYADSCDINTMMNLVDGFKKSKVIDFNLFTLIKNGLINGNKLEKYLNEKLIHKNIEEFVLPYTAVTVNILNGQQVLLNKGNAAFAMRASSAVPAVFSACPFEDKILVDGGLINNLPNDIVKQMGADYIIAVDCLGDINYKEPPKNAIASLMTAANIMINNNMYKTKKIYNTLIKVNTLTEGKFVGVSNLNKDGIEEAIEMGRVAAQGKIKKILRDLKKLEAI